MLDAVILSDIHLGSDNCQARRLCRFLERIADGELATARLILNGDVFDSFDFRRLKKSHWKVLSLIRNLADRIAIIWICGNHDGSAEVVSHLLGVTVKEEYILVSGQERILILHGHIFDEFLDAHPVLSWLADLIYWLLQKIDKTHTFAKLAKKHSKTWLRCAQKIKERSVAHARYQGCTAVCCGHTHQAVATGDGPVRYFNSGCWTESPGTYLTVSAGSIQVHTFGEDDPDELGEVSLAAPCEQGMFLS